MTVPGLGRGRDPARPVSWMSRDALCSQVDAEFLHEATRMPVCLRRSMDALKRIWETRKGVCGDDGREQCQEGHEASVDASSRKSRCA